jgi:hypothetical protein
VTVSLALPVRQHPTASTPKHASRPPSSQSVDGSADDGAYRPAAGTVAAMADVDAKSICPRFGPAQRSASTRRPGQTTRRMRVPRVSRGAELRIIGPPSPGGPRQWKRLHPQAHPPPRLSSRWLRRLGCRSRRCRMCSRASVTSARKRAAESWPRQTGLGTGPGRAPALWQPAAPPRPHSIAAESEFLGPTVARDRCPDLDGNGPFRVRWLNSGAYQALSEWSQRDSNP